MSCHGELRRPSAPAHLTSFYVSLSLGGMFGGLFAGSVAPYVFFWIAEISDPRRSCTCFPAHSHCPAGRLWYWLPAATTILTTVLMVNAHSAVHLSSATSRQLDIVVLASPVLDPADARHTQSGRGGRAGADDHAHVSDR